MKMLVEVYRSEKKEGLYIYVERGYDLSQLPAVLLEKVGRLERAMILLLTPEKKLARAKVENVFAAIAEQGFYLQLPPQLDDYMQQIVNDKLTSQIFN